MNWIRLKETAMELFQLQAVYLIHKIRLKETVVHCNYPMVN